MRCAARTHTTKNHDQHTANKLPKVNDSKAGWTLSLFCHFVDNGECANWTSFGMSLFHVSTRFGSDQCPVCRRTEPPSRIARRSITARAELPIVQLGHTVLLSHVWFVCVYEVSSRTSHSVDSHGDTGSCIGRGVDATDGSDTGQSHYGGGSGAVLGNCGTIAAGTRIWTVSQRSLLSTLTLGTTTRVDITAQLSRAGKR